MVHVQPSFTFFSEDRPYACQVCGKTFKTNKNLKLHIGIHVEGKPEQCRHEGCEKTFSSVRRRNDHERSFHGKGVEDEFKCNICDKVMPNG